MIAPPLDGLLGKLHILPFDDPELVQGGPPSGPPFIAQFNPETLSLATEIEYAEKEIPPGDAGGEAKFWNVKPRTFNFDLLLDGTGAAPAVPVPSAKPPVDPLGLDVLAQIELFRLTVGFRGKVHRPRFLLLRWGTFIVSCAIQSYTINYKLFRPDGRPLRAVIQASFKEHHPKRMRELLKNLSSPDVVHERVARDGDRLDLMANEVYGDARRALQVAAANGLDTIRKLEVGDTVHLPPTERVTSGA